MDVTYVAYYQKRQMWLTGVEAKEYAVEEDAPFLSEESAPEMSDEAMYDGDSKQALVMYCIQDVLFVDVQSDNSVHNDLEPEIRILNNLSK